MQGGPRNAHGPTGWRNPKRSPWILQGQCSLRTLAQKKRISSAKSRRGPGRFSPRLVPGGYPTSLEGRSGPGPFPLPKVPATRTPQLNAFLKSEVTSTVKASDKELAKIQTLFFDAIALLTSLLETEEVRL